MQIPNGGEGDGMSKYILLTRSGDGKHIFVNPQNIAFITTNYKKPNITIIQFTGNENNYTEVAESIDTVMVLLDEVTG